MSKEIRVAELFAGVGGFRLGLDGYDDSRHPGFRMDSAGNFRTVWANQWEPDGKESRQFAWRCYEERFGKGSCVNEDIAVVLDEIKEGRRSLPEFDMLVGGFPCQDYSVAKPLALASGIEGKKGVLWWSINTLLEMRHPKYVLLENVDRLLKSPSSQRGRDFAIILSCLYRLGYSVEWRVINAADYGMPQRRRRVYIYAEYDASKWNLEQRLFTSGVEARAFPIKLDERFKPELFAISDDPYTSTKDFGVGMTISRFKDAGVMQNGEVLSYRVKPVYSGPSKMLGDVLVPINEVPEEFFISGKDLESWKYLKGGKKEERTTKLGFSYIYSEGPVAFPDALDKPSRTILTGEGGRGASRTKHVVEQNGRLRRLVPDELDRLQGFPKGWTDDGMTDGHRAFCMGNALVTNIPHRIGKIIAADNS
ncbi:DNA (cytosine-5-)-methyltransferase [Bifidobacterium panos]|uniref:Cytosine-specific methyltransferase n=1 Tax=Bifidobacterium panos TaxID=2675321 RepID=A0ABX1SY87_9BIFI|nr:DNA (cytosine-5-)-methyltransferase [Bifidobacterium sp. DSM 109963]NMN02244.1 cytosine methyltransferase [Bifidobacterium sp. DSM 109963]